MHVVTEVDAETGALLARNAFRTDFAGRVAFADVDRRPRTLTADRTEFLGRHGSVAAPAALGRSRAVRARRRRARPLRRHPGPRSSSSPAPRPRSSSCSARPTTSTRPATLVRRYREPGRAAQALEEVKARWDDLLGTVQVRTPDPALDLLVNRWLLYQVLACRFWGRSAFYQSGGAYGFRDQLQDVMALVHAAPEMHAGADPPRGVAPVPRGRRAALVAPADGPRHPHADLRRPALAAVRREPLRRRRPATPRSSTSRSPTSRRPRSSPTRRTTTACRPSPSQPGSLYEHCLRGPGSRGHRLGAHGLPLMGHGDWNDGMNRVGAGGKGESVWLAWFPIAVLAPVRRAGRGARRRRPRGRPAASGPTRCAAAVEANAWDGDWYRRAYFDDGTPLGSAQNDECQIDSIAQSWAVLSGAGRPRARPPGDGVRRRAAGRPRGPADPAVHAAVRRRAARPRLHQGLPARHPRERRPVHPRGDLGRPGVRPARPGPAAPSSCSTSSTRSATPRTREGVERYKVEPYVVAGDVYSRPPHVGRGGWTWYTGSASWLYRTILEAILGFHRQGDRLTIDPCIPPDWPGFEITYRFRSATYRIAVENPRGSSQARRPSGSTARPSPSRSSRWSTTAGTMKSGSKSHERGTDMDTAAQVNGRPGRGIVSRSIRWENEPTLISVLSWSGRVTRGEGCP